MTAVTRPMRGRRPTKRLDLTDIKAALASGEQWTALGVVIAGEGGKPHWEILDGADIHVEVELQPGRERVFARLAAGMWIVPALGEEVAVILPAGDVTFMPTIACILANVIATAQGPQPGRILLVRDEVLVHDGAGGAVALALKSDVIALDNKYAAHLHLDGSGLPTSGPLKNVAENGPNPSFPSPDSVNPFLDPGPPPTPTTKPNHAGEGLDAANIVGTTVLKAK